MDTAFRKMNISLSKNLDCVNKHIEALNDGKNVIDQQVQLEPLTVYMEQMQEEVAEKLKNLTISHKMKNAIKSGLKAQLGNGSDVDPDQIGDNSGQVDNIVEEEMRSLDVDKWL